VTSVLTKRAELIYTFARLSVLVTTTLATHISCVLHWNFNLLWSHKLTTDLWSYGDPL